MTKRAFRGAMGLVMAGLLAGACTSTVDDEFEDDPTQTGTTTGTETGTVTGTQTGTVTGTGCGAGPLPVESSSTISECGGFAAPTDGSDPPGGDAPAYCDAEVLYWTYDADTRQLDLLDSRVSLNCCGEHSMTVERYPAGPYVVTERDEPMGGFERCSCTCVFDFALAVDDIEAEAFQLQLVRQITDGGASSVVFDGVLDLSEGSGFVVLDDEPVMFCGEEEMS